MSVRREGVRKPVRVITTAREVTRSSSLALFFLDIVVRGSCCTGARLPFAEPRPMLTDEALQETRLL